MDGNDFNDVVISSNPPSTRIVVKDEKGQVVYSGVTPATVKLPRSAGPYNGADYTVEFSQPGYQTTTKKLSPGVNAWYFGNLFFGGVIGILIVDPLTGAMWELPNKFSADLPALQAGEKQSSDLRVVSVSDVPRKIQPNMVQLQAPQPKPESVPAKLGFTHVVTNGIMEITSVDEGSPAGMSGVTKGQKVVSINGLRIENHPEVLQVLENPLDKQLLILTLSMEPSGYQNITFNLAP